MSRNPTAEAAALRQRLQDVQTRLNLLAMAVIRNEPGAQTLARLLLAGTLEHDGEMPEAAVDHQAVMPEARSVQHKE